MFFYQRVINYISESCNFRYHRKLLCEHTAQRKEDAKLAAAAATLQRGVAAAADRRLINWDDKDSRFTTFTYFSPVGRRIIDCENVLFSPLKKEDESFAACLKKRP